MSVVTGRGVVMLVVTGRGCGGGVVAAVWHDALRNCTLYP